MDPVTIVALVLPYIKEMFAGNESVKGFANDMLSATIAEVRPWFLDDATTTKMISEATSDKQKSEIIKSKINDVIQDQNAKEKLESLALAIRQREKNVLRDSEVEAIGSIRVGDRKQTETPETRPIYKNVIKNSRLKTDGDFTLGDSND